MDERQVQAVLATLLREVGRLEPGPSSRKVPLCGAAKEAARRWLAGRSDLAGLADSVAARIEEGAAEAYARFGLEFEPEELPSGQVPADLLEELGRIPEGPVEEVIAALDQVLARHFARLGPSPAPFGFHDLARVGAAVEDALVRSDQPEEPLLFIRGELVGREEYLFGANENWRTPPDLAGLVGRGCRVASLAGDLATQLLKASGSLAPSLLTTGGGGFLALVPNQAALVEALSKARARIEKDLLRQYEGELNPCIGFCAAPLAMLREGGSLLGKIEREFGLRSRTPFLDALLEPEPFGPFGSGMQDDEQVRSMHEADRELSQRAGFARVDMSAPMTLAYLRVRPAEPDLPAEVALLDAVAGDRRVDELIRTGAAELADDGSVTILTGSGPLVVAVGPLKQIIVFIDRLNERLNSLSLSRPRVLDGGVAVRSASQNGPGGAGDLGRLVRQARGLLREIAAVGPGCCRLFGAEVRTADLSGLQLLGDRLAELAAVEPSGVLALLETSIRIGSDGDAIPLSEVSRLRARVHQLAARLGVNARFLDRESAGDAGPLAGLAVLIRNFDRLFDSGAARVPLAYAVALSKDHSREQSP
ncbi:MAG: hypothetical protein V2A76_15125 [Planctomycetota bacterium]